jgi:superfamily I DNA/RNA helicase
MRHTDVQASFQGRAREAIQEFIAFVEETRAKLADEALVAKPDALQQWSEKFLNEIGYYNELRRSEKNQENAENRIRSLRDLIATMDRDGAGQPMSERLDGFLENITLDSEHEEEKEAGDAVTLITMHSCKGLEYPHVYVVGLEDGLLPHTRSKVEGTLDEERRLFYVAITRAKRELMISHCGGRKKYGQMMPCHPSPFLKELPEELVEDGDAKSRQPVKVESGKNLFAAMRASLD